MAEAQNDIAKDVEVKPLLPIPRLGGIVLQSPCPTPLLLQYLNTIPNALDAVPVIEEICKRDQDFDVIFPHLLSLSADHWHKPIFFHHLRKRLMELPIPSIKALQTHIPRLSALEFDDNTMTMQPVIGPLTSMDTSRWDTHDWFYQTLHAKQMKGQLLFITIALSLLSRVALRFL